jgi:hypothetical protein
MGARERTEGVYRMVCSEYRGYDMARTLRCATCGRTTNRDTAVASDIAYIL